MLRNGWKDLMPTNQAERFSKKRLKIGGRDPRAAQTIFLRNREADREIRVVSGQSP